jgi:hypothetical protein
MTISDIPHGAYVQLRNGVVFKYVISDHYIWLCRPDDSQEGCQINVKTMYFDDLPQILLMVFTIY